MPSTRRLVTIAATLGLVACSSSEPAGVPDEPDYVVGGVTGTLNPAGASFDLVAQGGVEVTVTFPAGAVESAQDIEIIPEDPPSGSWLNLTFIPEGLVLREPATVVLTLPDEISMQDQVLHWGDPADPLIAPTEVNEAARTLTTRTRTFGLPGERLVMPGPAGAAGLAGLLRPARTSHGSGGNNQLGALPRTCSQLVAEAEASFDRFVARKDFEAAMHAANAAAETLWLAACPAESDAFLDRLSTVGCQEMDRVQKAALDQVIGDFGDFDEQVGPVIEWAGVLQLAAVDVATQCTGSLDLKTFLERKLAEFISFVGGELASLPPFGWDSFQNLRLELARTSHLRVEALSMGLQNADLVRTDALYPLADQLREVSYGMAESGWHYPLSRLTSVGWLSGRDIIGLATPRPCDDFYSPPRCPNPRQIARFTDDDIFRDLQYAGTDVTVAGVTPAGSELGSDFAGGLLPDSWEDSPSLASPTRGTIRLSGELRAFTCWDDVEADMEVTVTLDGVEMLTLRRPVGGSDYLTTPATIDIAEAAALLPSPPSQGSTGKLVVTRTRTQCDERLWGKEEYELFTADLVWQNPTLDVDVQIPAQVDPGASVPVNVRVAVVDPLGVAAYFDGLDVNLSTNAGTLASTSGITDDQGWFTTTLTTPATLASIGDFPGSPTSHASITVEARADSYEGVTGTGQGSTTVGQAQGRALFTSVSHSANAWVRAFSADRRKDDVSDATGSWTFNGSVSIDTTTASGSVSASASMNTQSNVSVSGDLLSSVTGSITGSASYTASGETTGYPDSQSESSIRFQVVDGNVPFTLTATTSTSGDWLAWVEIVGPVSYGFYAEAPTAPPASLNESGVLPPGEYSFEVFWGDNQSGCQDCSINAQGSVSYSLTLGGS